MQSCKCKERKWQRHSGGRMVFIVRGRKGEGEKPESGMQQLWICKTRHPIHPHAVKHYLAVRSAVEDQNRSVIRVGVKAAVAVARWSRIMEERRRRATVQYYCGQRERAGGSLNATLRPLWYCEAAAAVAPGRDRKLQPPQRIKNWDQNRRQFLQEPKQKITRCSLPGPRRTPRCWAPQNKFHLHRSKDEMCEYKGHNMLHVCASETPSLYSHCRIRAVETSPVGH